MDISLNSRRFVLALRRGGGARPGFTLIEILLVAAILAAMTGFIAPRMNVAYKNLKLRAATRELEETIRYAAQDAVRRRKRIVLKTGPKAETYWLTDASAGRARTFGEEAEPPRLRETRLPKGIRAELSPEGGNADANVDADLDADSGSTGAVSLTFYPDGRRDTAILKVTDSRDRAKWIVIGRTLGAIEILNEFPGNNDDPQG